MSEHRNSGGAIGAAIRDGFNQSPEEDAYKAAFKRETGYEYPDNPAAFRHLMILAGFGPAEILAVQEGNWVGYNTPEAHVATPSGKTLTANVSFSEYLRKRLAATPSPDPPDTSCAKQPAQRKRGRPRGMKPETLEKYRRWSELVDDGYSANHIALHIENPQKDPSTVFAGIRKYRDYENKNKS